MPVMKIEANPGKKPKGKQFDERGFETFSEFEDTYGANVRVKESSAAEYSALWVFVKGGSIQAMHPDDSSHLRRMYLDEQGNPVAARWQDAEGRNWIPIEQEASAHLNEAQVKTLIKALQKWLDKQG